jgi:hypothetical protein
MMMMTGYTRMIAFLPTRLSSPPSASLQNTRTHQHTVDIYLSIYPSIYPRFLYLSNAQWAAKEIEKRLNT